MPKQMSDAAKAARHEYNRKWRARNREHIREYNKEYWERKVAEAKAAEATKQEPPRD